MCLAPADATLDADWRDDTVFAVCCADGSITVCKVGSQAPLKTWNAAPQGAEVSTREESGTPGGRGVLCTDSCGSGAGRCVEPCNTCVFSSACEECSGILELCSGSH